MFYFYLVLRIELQSTSMSSVLRDSCYTIATPSVYDQYCSYSITSNYFHHSWPSFKEYIKVFIILDFHLNYLLFYFISCYSFICSFVFYLCPQSYNTSIYGSSFIFCVKYWSRAFKNRYNRMRMFKRKCGLSKIKLRAKKGGFCIMWFIYLVCFPLP